MPLTVDGSFQLSSPVIVIHHGRQVAQYSSTISGGDQGLFVKIILNHPHGTSLSPCHSYARVQGMVTPGQCDDHRARLYVDANQGGMQALSDGACNCQNAVFTATGVVMRTVENAEDNQRYILLDVGEPGSPTLWRIG